MFKKGSIKYCNKSGCQWDRKDEIGKSVRAREGLFVGQWLKRINWILLHPISPKNCLYGTGCNWKSKLFVTVTIFSFEHEKKGVKKSVRIIDEPYHPASNLPAKTNETKLAASVASYWFSCTLFSVDRKKKKLQ